jgi:hypothetical protein
MTEAVTRGTGRGVVQITPYYPPALGGLERVAQALAETLAERREVEVLTTVTRAQPSADRDRGPVRVRRFRAVEVAHTRSPRVFFSRCCAGRAQRFGTCTAPRL